MAFAVRNASAGSEFSRGELGAILQEALLSMTDKFPNSTLAPYEGKSQNKVKIQNALIWKVPAELKGIFFPGGTPTKKKRNYNPVSILKERSEYTKELQKALGYLESVNTLARDEKRK